MQPKTPTVVHSTTSVTKLRLTQQNVLKLHRERTVGRKPVPYVEYTRAIRQYGQLLASWEREVTGRDKELTCLREENATQTSELEMLRQKFKDLQIERNHTLEDECQEKCGRFSPTLFKMKELQKANAELKEAFKNLSEDMHSIISQRYETSLSNGFREYTNRTLEEKLQSNTDRSEELENRISEKDKNISKFEQDTKDGKKICVDNSKEVTALQKVIENLEDQTDNIEKLERTIRILKAQMSHTDKMNATLKEQLEASIKQCKSLEEKVEELKRDLTDKGETIKELMLNCEQQGSELQMDGEIRHEEVELLTRNSELNTNMEMETSSSTITELKHQLDEKNEELQKSKSNRSELIRRRKQLGKKNRKLNVEIKVLSGQIRKLKETADLAKAERNQEMLELQQKFNKQIDDLKRNLTEKEECIKELLLHCEGRKLELQTERERHNEVELAWGSMSSELNAQVESTLHLLNSANTSKDQAIAKLQQELEDTELLNYQLSTLVQVLIKEVFEQDKLNGIYKSKAASQEQQLETLTQKSSKLENMNLERINKIVSQAQQLENMRANYEKLEAEITALKSDLMRKRKWIIQFLHERRKKCKKNAVCLAKLRNQIQKAENKKTELLNTTKRQEVTLGMNQNEITALKSDLMEKSKCIIELQHKKDKEWERITVHLAKRRHQIQKAERKKTELRNAIKKQECIMDMQESEIIRRRQLDRKRQRELNIRDQTIIAKNKEVSDKNKQLAALKRKIGELRRSFASKRQQLIRQCREIVECSQQV